MFQNNANRLTTRLPEYSFTHILKIKKDGVFETTKRTTNVVYKEG